MLIIDSTDGNFINQVQVALNTLAGLTPQAFTYTQVMGVTHGQWIDVSRGTGFGAASAARPHGVGLVDAVINSGYVARIAHGAGNATTAERTSPLYAPSLDYLRTETKIATRTQDGSGSSCVVNWTGQADNTCNLNAAQLGAVNSHIIESQCPSYIILAHELIHAERLARGVYDSQTTTDLYFLIDSRPGKNLTQWGTQNSKNLHQDQHTGYWYERCAEKMEEIITVGMPYANTAQFMPLPAPKHVPAHPLGITENDIRTENLLGIRLKYGNYGAGQPGSNRYIGNQ